MLCITMNSYTRACGGVSGGVSAVWLFDPSDFNFTQTTAGAAYSVIALRGGATVVGGAKLYQMNFQNKECEYTSKQTVKGISVKYAHEVKAMLPQFSNALTNFQMMLDQAGSCCGIGIILQTNDGKIFVLGEKYVNALPILWWQIQQSGSDGTTGKVFDDENGTTIGMSGDYGRPAYEFGGGLAALQAFM